MRRFARRRCSRKRNPARWSALRKATSGAVCSERRPESRGEKRVFTQASFAVFAMDGIRLECTVARNKWRKSRSAIQVARRLEIVLPNAVAAGASRWLAV